MSWFKSADKIADGVIEIGKKGLDLWDVSKFTAQEQINAFTTLVGATKDAATAVSRRYLLWFLMVFIAIAFAIGVYYNHTQQVILLAGLIDLVKELYIGPGFVAAVSFYYLTHAFKSLGK